MKISELIDFLPDVVTHNTADIFEERVIARQNLSSAPLAVFSREKTRKASRAPRAFFATPVCGRPPP
jgi:hypothetical protein